jgi:hypothetical protein
MNKRIISILNDIHHKKHHIYRQEINQDILDDFTISLKEQSLNEFQRSQRRFSWVLAREIPVILPDERIVFTRTVKKIPEIFTKEEWNGIKKKAFHSRIGQGM